MKFALFYHSLVSDWNHGNAHFLRGVVDVLLRKGHDVTVYEPEKAWSLQNLRKEKRGAEALKAFSHLYPGLRSLTYKANADPAPLLEGVDVALVHEWTDPAMLDRLARYREGHSDVLMLFHDTHHRAVTNPGAWQKLPLESFDGVLAFGQILAHVYRKNGWHDRVTVWHEAADTRVFQPHPQEQLQGDLVWVGNWGDNERTEELQSYLLDPIEKLNLQARIYGVRYPKKGLQMLRKSGAEFGGWLPNVLVPETFARYRMTAHVPRRAYVRDLPGIPTIRVFETLACGIPLVSAPWEDCEGLFRPGQDYLLARTPAEMETHMKAVLNEPDLAASLRRSGLERIAERHTCEHRVDELLRTVAELARKEVAV